MGILVFASHASKDIEFFKVREIAEELTNYNEIEDVLYWEEDLYDNIVEFMNEGVEKCDVFLLFCSKNASQSKPVQKEYSAAEILDKPIIPIFLEEKDMPALVRPRKGLKFDSSNFHKNIVELREIIINKVLNYNDSIIKVDRIKKLEIKKIEPEPIKKDELSSKFDKPRLKVLLCSSEGVEKTKLLQKFVKNRFAANYKLTVGVDILTKDVEYKPGKIKTLSIWDIEQQQRFEFIRSTFYKHSDGVLLIFDVAKKQTYLDIKKLLIEVRQFAGDNLPFVILGINPSLIGDLKDIVNREEVRKYAQMEGGIYVETSVETGENIEYALKELTNKIVITKELMN